MKSRRTFLKTAGKGLAVSSMALSSTNIVAETISPLQNKSPKPIRIGIIGAENSHAGNFGKMFNVDKKFPGVDVHYIWGETEDFAKNAMEKGKIPNMVKDPKEMLGKIDALIVDHRHAKYHLEAARPFVEAGIPTFIDKPFCYRVNEGKKFLSMAREKGTPITSYSTVAHSEATLDIKKQIENLGEISHVITTAPADFDSQYGGIFFYGVHSVQPLMYIFGDDIKKVRATREGENATASLAFGNGMLATLIFKRLSYGWSRFVECKEGTIELKSKVEESDPAKAYVDMVEMFRTGKEPRSHESILKCVAVLEALEKSGKTGQWTDVLE